MINENILNSTNGESLEEFLVRMKQNGMHPLRDIIGYVLNNYINPSSMKYSVKELLTMWAQHDAIHFYTGLTFTEEHEKIVAWYENFYDLGFNKISVFFNMRKEDSPPVTINQAQFSIVTEEIKRFYQDHLTSALQLLSTSINFTDNN